MADSAISFLRSFHWCPTITAIGLGFGVGGIFGLFLVEFAEPAGGSDDRLWVVTGDLPSTYFVVEPGETIAETIERYCSLMDDWSGAVLTAGDFEEVFPVRAARTKENAIALRGRMKFLREEVIPLTRPAKA